MSPTIFRQGGFRFFFFSREEPRLHVHVHCADFPWFKDVPIAKLANVQRPQPHHLHWPDLDVDLAVESIRDPKKFPLIAKHR